MRDRRETNVFLLSLSLVLFFVCFSYAAAERRASVLSFGDGTLGGWTVEGEGTWNISGNPDFFNVEGGNIKYVANSLERGESNVGVLRSPVFEVTSPLQVFQVSGWDGVKDRNDGENNYVILKSSPDGKVIKRAHVPGDNKFSEVQWLLDAELIGKEVYIEVVDNNPATYQGGFAWIAFGGYHQKAMEVKNPVKAERLYGLKIDAAAEQTLCRSMPFMAAGPGRGGETTRVRNGDEEIIPVNAKAETLYLLGMINDGWDNGVAHWGEHQDLIPKENRTDLVYIGSEIGEIEIKYEDGKSDTVPVVMGATAWFVAQWLHGPSHGRSEPVMEPFVSREGYMQVFRDSLKLYEDENYDRKDAYSHYYLAIKPRNKKIESIIVRDNPEYRGVPLVSAVNVKTDAPTDEMVSFGAWTVDATDLPARVNARKKMDFSKQLDKLADVLYMSESDLPKKVEPVEFAEGLDGAKLRFMGGIEADMLNNVWNQNLAQLNDKFEPDTGFFHESGLNFPWYGGYQGIGTWSPIGVYYTGAFGRCSDHFATLVLRCLNNPQRWTSYVDFLDKNLYFFRPDHDPNNGPANGGLDIERYPKDMPPHWGFVIGGAGGFPINELQFDEETDGHGSTIVGRWAAWRLMGAPKGEWLMQPRSEAYGKSRWDSTRDAAEYICWLMDYTQRDVMWCEGETTGWAAITKWENGQAVEFKLVPEGMANETDPEKIKKNYANANMYEPYPTYVCLTALRCSAQIADAAGDAEKAARWRKYADRLQAGMLRLLFVGDHNNRMWRVSTYSVYTSFQDSLVQAWFSIYYDGLDPNKWNKEMTEITRNTLKRQLSQEYGHEAVLAMGYGQGWLAKSALILDEMDDAGPLLTNIAKYSYDKNMDYVDEARGIDWRKYLWLIPEGTTILPNGMWYRIGDLTNGANQGPAMHALELCAGVDDTNPADLKILPRTPDPLYGIAVEEFLVLVPKGEELQVARVSYTYDRKKASFELTSDVSLPTLSVRMGPFTQAEAEKASKKLAGRVLGEVRTETSGHYSEGAAYWVWVEGMSDVQSVVISAK